ncbi:MAG: hypothetical protein JST92_23715, partial [Deltaproteobacteria bacterium]|nr:hypothetical protein [Deltaproteobacteria bacterium]
MRQKSVRAALFLTLGALATACTPDFESAEIVRDLRVLDVKAEPPEAVFDVDAGTVDKVTVSVLFADPGANSSEKATLDASACAPTDNGLCADPSILLTHQQGPIGEQSFDVQVPPALIAAALQSDDLKGLSGIPVQVSLTVQTADPAGPQAAQKLVVYSKKDPN